jgi:hypothetical protein
VLSRIENELGLNGGQVQVCGPITWEDHEQTAEFGFFLRQKGKLLVGSSQAKRGDKMWMGKVRHAAGGDFAAGAAAGTVIVVVQREGGEAPTSASWAQDVRIVEGSHW